LSRHISGKKELKKTKTPSSGIRIPRPIVFFLGFLLIAVGFFGVLYNPANSIEGSLPWEISEAGTLSFPQREKPVFTAQEIEDLYSPEDPDILKLVSFESSGEKVQALLRVPANSPSSAAGIVLLPGAGVSKEGEQGLAAELSKMGYATLTLLSVQPEIDPKRLAILGESNGGRFAIIACALDPSLKGVIGISTSGYDTEELDPVGTTDSEVYRFYRSIDPDTYLSALPPSRLVMIHSFNDTVIPHEMALRTFGLAKEPKAMYNTTEETHGYTASMRSDLEKELKLILN